VRSLSDPDDTLQAQGEELLARLASGEAIDVEVDELVARLRSRDWEGDDVLAEELTAGRDGVVLLGRRLQVALDELAGALEGDPVQDPGYLDLRTGEVVPGFMTDPMWVGEDDARDVDEEADDHLALPMVESRSAWHDMAVFAERADQPLRDRLERALRGRGAFRGFRDELARAEVLRDFHAFSDDRQRGRARAFLATQGVRAVPRPARP
jgi:hypothetical protein